MSDLPIHVRHATDADAGSIYGPWLEAFKLSHAAGPIPMDLYWSTYRETLKRLIARSVVLVAASTTDENQHFGWLVHELHAPPIVHFLYVKYPFRRNGIGKILMAAAGIPTGQPFIYTFKTPTAAKFLRAARWSGAVFDPLKARFAENR